MATRKKLSPDTTNHLQTFHCFAELPPELRLIIWDFNLPGPRIVEIKCTESAPQSELQQDETTRKFTSSVPVNLHVCQESRIDALRRYRYLFQGPSKNGQVIFNPLRDTLYFGATMGVIGCRKRFESFLSLVQPEDLANIRHIAINDALISNEFPVTRTTRFTFEYILRRVHQHFTSLQMLTFVCEDHNPIYSPDAILVEPKFRNRLLERYIQMAIKNIEDQESHIKLPPWDVRAIAGEPNSPVYDQRVLGYRGSQQTFFRKFRLRELQIALAT